jgi:hypothetical protein
VSLGLPDLRYRDLKFTRHAGDKVAKVVVACCGGDPQIHSARSTATSTPTPPVAEYDVDTVYTPGYRKVI